MEKLLSDKEIKVAVNLTVPHAHAKVSLAALSAGKHVYSEKPFAVSCEDGKKILATAKSKDLTVGNAPDTFLGSALQTVRKLIDEGWIGDPHSATAFMMSPGHEHWHPDPEFFYQTGGGPLFDMGPYYLTALVHLLGPVERVCSFHRKAFDNRTIISEKKFGQQFPVEISTHLTGLLEFKCGVVVTVIFSFDVWASTLPNLQIFGSEGTLQIPDPNGFGGMIKIFRGGTLTWSDIPLLHGNSQDSRGLGVVEMVESISDKREPRASGRLAYHVLEVMQALVNAGQQRRYINIESSVERPDPLPTQYSMQGLDALGTMKLRYQQARQSAAKT